MSAPVDPAVRRVVTPHGNGDDSYAELSRGLASRGNGDDPTAHAHAAHAPERSAGLPAGAHPDPHEVKIAGLVRELLTELGEDPERQGLHDTPKRAARALRWLTRGYQQDPEEVIGNALFEERHGSMVLVRDIELYSLCEHHMLPFFGRAHVAYVPGGRIVGLSKMARLVEVFARRLQVQERLTDQIADALVDVLAPRGVGVVLEAQHLCMMMRGVEKQNSSTVTSALRGVFADCPMTREEFLRLALR